MRETPEMPQVAQFLWVGDKLSNIEALALRSFVATGYDTRLYTYTPGIAAPSGVTVMDAGEIVPADQVFTSPGIGAKPTYANFSDVFRYRLLAQKGGWWFDADMVALKYLPEPSDLRFASTWEDQWGECANGCAMWCRAGDARMIWLRDECERILASGVERGFLDLGPGLVQRLVREQSLEANVAPWWEFCPYPWRVVRRTAQTSLKDVILDHVRLAKHLVWQQTRQDFRAGYVRPGSRALHLHNEVWASSGMNKDSAFHPLSVLGRLMKKYA